MTKALLRIRFRSLLAMFLQRNTGNKKQGIGMTILFAFLYLYLGAVMCGMSGFLFYTLSEPYHMMDLDWLYFAMAGLMGLGMAGGAMGGGFNAAQQFYNMGAQQQAAAPAADGWKCACGATATGKFCPECGAKKPEPKPAGWKCACGATATG